MISRIKTAIYKRWYESINLGTIILDQEKIRLNFSINEYGTEEKVSYCHELYQTVNQQPANRPSWMNLVIGNHVVRSPFYYVFRNSWLLGRYATAVTNEGKVILPTICNSVRYLFKSGDRRVLNFNKIYPTYQKFDVVFSLINPLSRYYYHWLTECLPLLEAYFSYIRQTSIVPSLLIDINPPKFQLDSLREAGVNMKKIVYWHGKKASVNNLLIASVRYENFLFEKERPGRIYPKSAFTYLRNLYNCSSYEAGYEKIYISRADADSRRIENEDELMSFLAPLGFQKVILSKMSFSSQIALFKNAKVLITPHGAALANTIFSSALTIVELFPEGRDITQAYYYYQISYHFGHNHYLLQCSQVNDRQNIYCDLMQLKEILAANSFL